MAMQCPRCSFQDADNTVTVCPRCGVTMRFSLLADYKPVDEKDHFAAVKIDEPLGTNVRFKQWLKGVALTQFLALFFAAGAIGYVMVVRKIKPGDLLETDPNLRTQIMYGVPVAATILGVMMSCWGLYMSQFIGMIIGIAIAPILLAERLVIRSEVSVLEWMVLPIVLGVCGFLVGLLITGRLKSTPIETQYKPMDSWDRTAEARYEEIEPGPTTRINRLIAGFVGSILVFELIYMLMRSMLNPLYNHNTKMVESLLANDYRLPMEMMGALVAGTVAGSGSTWGKFQGLLGGLGFYGYCYYSKTPTNADEIIKVLVPCLFVGMIGGVIGRHVFGPYKMFRGPKIKPDATKL